MEAESTCRKRYILVQPPMVIVLFALSMSGNIFTDLIVYRTCMVTLGLNKTECLLLHENSSSKEALKINSIVQPQASLIIMTKSFIDSVLPAFLSLFLGPWSDKYGRKPLMLSGYIGMSLTYFILTMMTVWDISPWFFPVAYIPSACFGGFCILILACACYVSDLSNDQNRAWYLACFDGLISLGVLMGMFVGPIIFNQYGYTAVFGSATVCCMLAGLYVCFCVSETVQDGNSKTLKSLFDVSIVKDLLNVCIKRRDGFDRGIIWCCIACLTLIIITLQGEMTVGFLFASARLGWDVKTYSDYAAINIIVSILGTIIAIRLLKKYGGFSDEVISILSLFSSLGGAITRSLTLKPWHMYLVIIIEMFSSVATPTIRAILAKSVPSHDVGKVFSLTISIETLTPLGAASLYGMVYSYFMPPFYPTPVWLVSAGFFTIGILLIISIKVQRDKASSVEYTLMSQDVSESS